MASRMIALVFLARMRLSLSVRSRLNDTASSEIDAGFGGKPTDVLQFWLCRLKPSTGLKRSRSAFSARPFRRLQPHARRD